MSDKIEKISDEIEKMSDELEKVKNNNNILMENQKKLWNYLNLFSNRREIIQSIIFNLYEYFGLEGQKETFK